jgi:hypothetical protein
VEEIKVSLISEYTLEVSYISDYEDYYAKFHPSLQAFINGVADLVIAGVRNGADEMVGSLFRSFLRRLPLADGTTAP